MKHHLPLRAVIGFWVSLAVSIFLCRPSENLNAAEAETSKHLKTLCSFITNRQCIDITTGSQSVDEARQLIRNSPNSIILLKADTFSPDQILAIVRSAKDSNSKVLLVIDNNRVSPDWIKSISGECTAVYMDNPDLYSPDWIKAFSENAARNGGSLFLNSVDGSISPDWIRSIVSAGAVVQLDSKLTSADWAKSIAESAQAKGERFYLRIEANNYSPDWLKSIAEKGAILLIDGDFIPPDWAKSIALTAKDHGGKIYLRVSPSFYAQDWRIAIMNSGGVFVQDGSFLSRLWLQDLLDTLTLPRNQR